ncbi:MAG: hypothetical protein ACM3US_15480 [Sphingomonadaceae bacterium]
MTDFLQGPQILVLASILLLVLLWKLWCRYYLSPPRELDPESENRAAALLRELLSEGEHQQLVQTGYLSVPSRHVVGRVYRVPVRPGWVDVYEADRLAMRICVEPVEQLPQGDVVLMHKLMIEGAEQEYLRIANIVYVRPPVGVRWRRYQH